GCGTHLRAARAAAAARASAESGGEVRAHQFYWCSAHDFLLVAQPCWYDSALLFQLAVDSLARFSRPVLIFIRAFASCCFPKKWLFFPSITSRFFCFVSAEAFLPVWAILILF